MGFVQVYCSVRDWTRICYVIGIENIRIHPTTRYRFRWGFIFSPLESGVKNVRIRSRIRRMRVKGSRIRKEKVADSKISGYMWTGPKTLAKTPVCACKIGVWEDRIYCSISATWPSTRCAFLSGSICSRMAKFLLLLWRDQSYVSSNINIMYVFTFLTF